MSASTLQAMWQIVIGTRSTDELGGPLRIAQMSGEVAQGGIVAVVWFMAVLSINLGLINLFPVPVLDGGHLLFYAAEALRGKPLGQRAQEYGFRIGLALVLTLMVFATWNDLVSTFGSSSLVKGAGGPDARRDVPRGMGVRAGGGGFCVSADGFACCRRSAATVAAIAAAGKARRPRRTAAGRLHPVSKAA